MSRNRTAQRTPTAPVRLQIDVPSDLASELQKRAANTPLTTLIVQILDEHGQLPIGESNPLFLDDEQRSRVMRALGGGEIRDAESFVRAVEQRAQALVGPFKVPLDTETIEALLVCNPNMNLSDADETKREWIEYLLGRGLMAVREGSVLV